MGKVNEIKENVTNKTRSLWQQLKTMGLAVALTLAIGFLASVFLPWWIVVVIAALVAAFLPYRNGGFAFAGGSLAVFVLWLVVSWYYNSRNGGLLAAKMGELFGNMDGVTLLWTVAVLGGILGGLGAMTGYLGRNLFFPKNA